MGRIQDNGRVMMDAGTLAEALTSGKSEASGIGEDQQEVAGGANNPIRPQALRKAMELFWERGVENTTYAHIVDATGLSRSALRRLWPNKAALVGDALALYRSAVLDRQLSTIHRGGKDDLSRYWSGLERDARGQGWAGCLLFRSAMGAYGADDSVNAIFGAYVEQLHDRVQFALREAQRAGEIAISIHADAVAWQCVSIISLISAIGASSGYDARVDRLFATGRASCGVS